MGSMFKYKATKSNKVEEGMVKLDGVSVDLTAGVQTWKECQDHRIFFSKNQVLSVYEGFSPFDTH